MHWVLYDDPGETRALSGEVPRSGELPNGIRQGRNSWGDIGYRGPDPPAGPEHRYYLHALAVSAALDLPPGADATQVRAAARPRILAEARYLGTYGRP